MLEEKTEMEMGPDFMKIIVEEDFELPALVEAVAANPDAGMPVDGVISENIT